ncbi:MAG: uL15 family ribosomal protein [Candidatus Micrarchaeota archaeon]|nr:uL15 family ribosomal protein [Candidatus Micrarchaeota archaeon]MCX8154288.1 uL15 family ribosomal protein [Candidatus Micrarchaeota archaeon]
MKHTEFENPLWNNTVGMLRRIKQPFWRAVLEIVDRSRRRRVVVSIEKVNRYYREGKIVIIPGKLLGGETLKHKAKVVAVDASRGAIEMIKRGGGEFIYMEEFLKNIDGIKPSDLMIIR